MQMFRYLFDVDGKARSAPHHVSNNLVIFVF